MNAISPICLTDLAPALRWHPPTELTPFLRHSRLIDGWWLSLPLPRVLDIAGAAWLSHNLALLAVEYWEHLPIGDFLPALRGTAVAMDDIAEPVRGALRTTAGGWEGLVNASPAEMKTWAFPQDCGRAEVMGAAAWRALQPFGQEGEGTPLPSPALIIEAVRTIAHWMPDSAPEHVHRALAYLGTATGADAPAPEPVGPPQSPATRAIRTLRALRAQHAEESGADASTRGSHHSAPAAPPSAGPSLFTPSSAVSPAAAPAPPAAQPTELGAHPLVDLVEELLRGWSPLERTVAAERLFAAEPISIRLLADQISTDIKEIRAAQRSVEERLLQWLSSPSGEPVGRHMRDLGERLGAATTIETLIGAHPDHRVTVPSLNAPLWRVVITFFTDRRMHNGWLVADDPERLRWQTREMLGDAPTLSDAGVRLGRIGIRRESLRAWLLSTSGIEVRDGRVLLDPSLPLEGSAPAPGYGGRGELAAEPSTTTTNGLPIRRRPGTDAPAAGDGHDAPPEPPATAPPGIATSPRCFRAPDGRWWHRVDIGADHLTGAPVTVPPGYATHLGLQPGRLLCLTAPGADLLVLVWRDEPAFDSLRPLLRRLSAQPGDRLFITVEGDRLDARRLPAAELGGHGSTGRALHLIGYTAPAATDEALRIIARRISADDGDTGSPDPQSLLERLAQRGDDDIAEELRQSLFAPH